MEETVLRKAGGNWADGDRFFDREAEVKALIERIRDGRHTLLTAQRRMGKTSLVRETLRRRMLRCCIPHHVQQFFDYLHEELRRIGRRAATSQDVDRVYETDMLGIRGSIDLDHYQSRLAMVLGSESQRIAIELLTEAAVNHGELTEESISRYERYFGGTGETNVTPVRDVLLLLEHDGYLAKTPDGYRFVSRLVEDWWRARFGMNFVPIGRRKLDAEG